MHLFLRIIRKLRHYVVVLTANILLSLIAIVKKRSTRWLIICYPLGDTCYGLAFSRYLESKGKCKYVVCKNQKQLIVDCYPCISTDDVYYYARKGFWNDVITYISFHYYVNRFYGKFNIIATIPYAYYRETDYIQESYLNYLRKMFKLNSEIPSMRPLVPFCECPIKADKMAILNPFSNSMEIDNELYWEEIAFYLLDKGFAVYTNVLKNQTPIKNTKPLDCNIFDLYNIVNQNKSLFISVRSGIVDFLIGSEAKFLVIYYLDENLILKSLRNFCNLTMWEQGKDNVVEVESNDNRIVEKTHLFIEKYSN